MLQGFKEFISRGNAIDLAVGVIIGGAFTPIVTAVTNLITGIIAAFIGKPNFDSVLEFSINGTTLQPGAILTALVNFLLIAIALYFFIVVPMNKLAERRTVEDPEPEEMPENVQVLTEIRDLLAANRGGAAGSTGSTVL